MITGRTLDVVLQGKPMHLYNQRSLLWTHPYARPGIDADDTLSRSGCGIFAICHLAQWLTGQVRDPDVLADFSIKSGGRGNDGTDRPALLAAMQSSGLAKDDGFAYRGDSLENDLDALLLHMKNGGCALCNLRPGHIVALVDVRERAGRFEYLVLDSFAESADPRLQDAVTEAYEHTLVTWAIRGKRQQVLGYQSGCLVYWVEATQPKDYNRIYPIYERKDQ